MMKPWSSTWSHTHTVPVMDYEALRDHLYRRHGPWEVTVARQVVRRRLDEQLDSPSKWNMVVAAGWGYTDDDLEFELEVHDELHRMETHGG